MKTIRNILYFTIFILYTSATLLAQSYDPSKVNKKAVALYDQAMERLQDENYILATGLLLKCIETDKNYLPAYLSLGGVYGQLKNYKNSVEYYEKAFALDSNTTMEYKLPYSINLAGLGEFEKALAAINELLIKKPPKNPTTLKSSEYRKHCYEFAMDYANKNLNKNYVFTPQNMGDGINSTESEYFPSMTIDGNEFVFTRNVKGHNEDFFYSHKNPNGWDKALPVEGDVNTEQNEGAQNISQDGQWLVFTGCNRPDGFGGCDIYISYLTKEGWSEAINLGGTVNSDQWDSQPCLSPDKRDLYFSSRRFGGFGGSDLYVCHLNPNGRWSEPENLGYPINTIADEATLFIAADAKTAYYTSDRPEGYGGLDIYSFQLREDVRPKKTLWVKGIVFDKKTTKGLPSAVELIDLATKELITKVQTDETGNYLITLPVGKDYAFNVNRKGYLFYSDNFSFAQSSPDSIYEKNIPLQPIETNATVVLKNIFFDVNKYELKTESQTELDKVAQLLNENPTLKIEIGGHTDNVGKPADNLILSNNRAKSVIDYLINKNIDTQRLTPKGYGETKPVADNSTEEGRAMNRRTEMKVLGQ